MSTNAIIGSGTTNPTGFDRSTNMPVKMLGQDDFFKILTTQLTTQDPLNPLKDTEFIGQMAQFSSLEQSRSMQTEMARMRADSLLGRTVELRSDAEGVTVGTVSAVHLVQGTPKIVVDGALYDLNQVQSVVLPAH